jgi:hypothetical protein
VLLSQRQTPATSSFLQQSGRRILAIVNRLAHSKPAKRNGTARFIQSTSCARALRTRALGCLSARSSHPSLPPHARYLKHRSCPRACCNGDARMHHAGGYGIARECYAQQPTLLVARMTASESVSITQLAAVLPSAKPFSILHSHSKFAISCSSGDGGAIFTVPVASFSGESPSVNRKNQTSAKAG